MLFRRTPSASNVDSEKSTISTGGSARSLARQGGGGGGSSNRSIDDASPVPYQHLMKAQLARFSPLLRGNYELNNNFNFKYHGYDVSFDVSNDSHTFMVSAIVYQVSAKEDSNSLERLSTRYLQVERSLVDMRMEWNEDYDILIYQNLPIGLVQEDCLEEFQTVLTRFLSEISVVNTSLQQVSSRSLGTTKGSSQKPKLMRIFNGRAA